MSGSYENRFDEEAPLVRQLTKGQRRVLGVLIEKGLTTPDQYPLTLKASTTGANQKSNRDPVTNYTEGAVWDLFDELRELGLIAVVHPESGRTERFRHYMRKRFPFNEPQLAIMAELFLRGKQQLGELRSRASRMVPIESLTELRNELRSLQEQGFIQASGDLERRGIEVDHNMYLETEGQQLEKMQAPTPEVAAPIQHPAPAQVAQQPAAAQPSSHELNQVRDETASLRSEVESLRQTVSDMREDLDELKRSLGV
ncbi:DUF480 domain-containing protein [Thalassoglobus polymorphus]|nr:DUF480 domain-containing protein [Thalassoglobus polymorphus]